MGLKITFSDIALKHQAPQWVFSKWKGIRVRVTIKGSQVPIEGEIVKVESHTMRLSTTTSAGVALKRGLDFEDIEEVEYL